MNTLLAATLAATVALLAGCGQGAKTEEYAPTFTSSPGSQEPEYIFAVHPLHNPGHLFKVYGPLVDYLNAHVRGARFRFEASRSYADFENRLYGRVFHFAAPNPLETVYSLQHGYHVFAKYGDGEKFRGIILVRRDSGIARATDLQGKVLSFPAPTALAATMMPLLFLQKNGLDVGRDVRVRYVGSMESTIMSVYLGNTAAGGIWPLPWETFSREHPDIAGQLKVQWQTDILPQVGLVARDDVPASIREQVTTLLLDLHQNPEGRAVLAKIPLSRYERANDETYQVVRDFMKEYEHLDPPRLDERAGADLR